MKLSCPKCQATNSRSDRRPTIVRAGFFRRKSDYRYVQRYECRKCDSGFSKATFDPRFGQKKRHLNPKIERELRTGTALRQISREMKISRTTVLRKLEFLGRQAEVELKKFNSRYPKVHTVEFDEMISFEHTKLKPLSMPLAVESGTRRILGLKVCRMAANGRLAALSQKKYGPRADERSRTRIKLLQLIDPFVTAYPLIKTDEHPHYPKEIREYFGAGCTHKTYKGRKACIAGQGELKRGGRDPLYSINHTSAKFRAHVSRLFRRTWNTTKKPENLAAHMNIFALYHNRLLKKQGRLNTG